MCTRWLPSFYYTLRFHDLLIPLYLCVASANYIQWQWEIVVLSEGYNYSLQFYVTSSRATFTPPITRWRSDVLRRYCALRSCLTARVPPLRRAESLIFSQDTSLLPPMNSMTSNPLGPAKFKPTKADQIALLARPLAGRHFPSHMRT